MLFALNRGITPEGYTYQPGAQPWERIPPEFPVLKGLFD